MAKKYRVTSRANTLGRKSGTVFTAEIPKHLEAQLLERGALERVKRSEDTEEKKDAGNTSQPTSSDRS